MKKQASKLHSPHVTSLLIFIALALAVISLLFGFSERSRLNTLYDQTNQQYFDMSYKTSRVSFCYERNLRPCSDDVIRNWNAKHPDDTITLSQPQIRF